MNTENLPQSGWETLASESATIARVVQAIEVRGLTQLTEDVRVVKAALGADSCAIGGISLVLSDLLSLPKIAL